MGCILAYLGRNLISLGRLESGAMSSVCSGTEQLALGIWSHHPKTPGLGKLGRVDGFFLHSFLEIAARMCRGRWERLENTCSNPITTSGKAFLSRIISGSGSIASHLMLEWSLKENGRITHLVRRKKKGLMGKTSFCFRSMSNWFDLPWNIFYRLFCAVSVSEDAIMP